MGPSSACGTSGIATKAVVLDDPAGRNEAYGCGMEQRSVIELFEGSAGAFRSVLVAVRPEHHRAPTPCAPLDVSALVARAIGHQNWVRERIAGRSDPPSYPPIEPDAWMAAFDDSTRSMVEEIGRDGAMDRAVTLAPELTLPGSDVAVLAARNIFQFAWDLAVATGQNRDLAPAVATELLDISRSRLVPQRGPDGFFGPEVVPPVGAPVATVLAGYLGREV